MTSAVVNSTPLIGLSILGKLTLLQELFDQVLIPESVYQEVAVHGAGKIGAEEVKKKAFPMGGSPPSHLPIQNY